MTLVECEHVKSLFGYKLWKVMKWAEAKGKMDVFKTCYQRAKELNHRDYGDWNEAKSQFMTMNFPTVKKDDKYFYQTTRLLGYLVSFSQEMDDEMTIKSKSMAIYNQKTNDCIYRMLVANKEVLFQ